MRERDDSIFDNQRFMQMGAQVQLIVLEFEYFGFLTRRSKSPEWDDGERVCAAVGFGAGKACGRMIPTPSQLFAQFERGEIEREELHSLMALHARELIAEMEEDRLNPAAAWIEGLLARQAAARLARRHGGRLLREVLVALAEVPDFPPARYLWNAAHPDVPLHCFLRIRREPVLRILSLASRNDEFEVMVEYGAAKRGMGTRRKFILRRDGGWQLRAEAAD